MLYIILFLCFFILTVILKNKATSSLSELASEVNNQTDKINKELKILEDNMKYNKSASKLDKGSIIDIDMQCEIVGWFFHEDNKYGVVLPRIFDKLIDFPGIIKIENDTWQVEFNSTKYNKGLSEEIVKKSAQTYSDFKQKNKKRFIQNKEQ